MASLKDFNPIAPETIENPYPFYRAMREQAPVYEIPGVGFFIVSRYDDILHVLANPQIFSSHQVRGLQSKPSAEVKKIWATGWPPVDTLQTERSAGAYALSRAGEQGILGPPRRHDGARCANDCE